MKLVCPRALIDRLEGRNICVYVDDARDIAAAAAEVRRRNTLACVICASDVALEDIEIEESWRGVPIALMTPSVGRVCNIAGKLAALRALNGRIFLPCEALTGVRVLASLGIPVCITFESAPDWDALADLMTYALLGLVSHAPVEPFQTIADGYRQASRCDDWGRVFFDDPARYLHLDADGRIALSPRELRAGTFVADFSQLDTPELAEAVRQRSDAWRDLFAGEHFCARCPSWRLCRGRFRKGKAAPDGCAAFFAEMAAVIEQRRASRRGPKWQP